jgi:hypothetical protein
LAARTELVGSQSYAANDFEGTFDTPTFTSGNISDTTSAKHARATRSCRR